MKTIILAAGEGTRLRPITYYVPKPMIPFFGKPFLEYTLENLVGLVDSVVMVVNYKQEQIRDYFGSRYNSLPIEYVVQQNLKGTAAALMAAKNSILECENSVSALASESCVFTAKNAVDNRFLVIQGDVYACRGLIQGMKKMRAENALSLVKVVDPENHAGIEHHNGIVRRTFADSPWIDRGIWLFSPVIFDYIEKIELRGGELRTLVAIQEMVNDGIDVQTYTSQEHWIQLGDHAPLESVLSALKFFVSGQEQRTDSLLSQTPNIECSSVDVETIGSKIFNSLVFGKGKIIDSVIENSLLYCRNTIRNQTIVNRILA